MIFAATNSVKRVLRGVGRLIHRSAWRNCLEIRNESRSGDCRAARRGRRVVYLPLLAPTTHPPEAFQLFSKQFNKEDSPTFVPHIWEGVPEVRLGWLDLRGQTRKVSLLSAYKGLPPPYSE